MIENLLASLEVTALGMGLTFLAIILLWWMMWALTAIRFKDDDASGPDSPEPVSTADDFLKAQAAAVAVAVALAEQEFSSARPLSQPPPAIVSAWQLGMRTRQMYEKGGR